VKVRPFEHSDTETLASLFTASVHVLTAALYSEAQRSAWAPQPPDLALWRRRLSGLQTLVAHDADRVLGFISYETDGHIDLLYTAPGFERRGVASLLLASVEIALLAVDLYTEANLVAEPFFSRHGFQIIEEQNVLYRGVEFRRYAMRRPRDFNQELHSARLLLRPVTLRDLLPLAHAAQTTDNARIDTMIRNSRDCWQRHGYGMWVIVPKGADSLIGWCGLRPIQTPGEPELLYGLAEPARGLGFAAEAARAVVEFAFGLPDVSGVWAATTPDHLASIHVMERSGMSFDCRAHLDGVDSVIYRLRR